MCTLPASSWVSPEWQVGQTETLVPAASPEGGGVLSFSAAGSPKSTQVNARCCPGAFGKSRS